MIKTVALVLLLGFIGVLRADENLAVEPQSSPVRVLPASDDKELEARLTELKRQAEQCSPEAAREIYTQYAVAGKSDIAQAWANHYLEILEDKAEKGDTPSMSLLGVHYLTGKDYTNTDIEKGVKWLYRAAEAGEPRAAFILGDYFSRQGNKAGSHEAYEKAYTAYSERAARGEAEALYWQGYMQQNGLGTEKEPQAGIDKLEQAAAQNQPWAMQQLFKTYAIGIGTEKDMKRAIAYARQAADTSGDGLMAYATACAYLKGEGVEKDETTGRLYLDKAVTANIPQAIYYKGMLLEKAGREKEAFPLYLQGASMGQADCMIAEARFLLYGLGGIEKDESRGLSLLQAASDRWDSPRAPYELAVYYDSADEPGMANSWYLVASERGVQEAFARRGLLHLNPFSGIEWSPTLTYQWWRAGSNAGDATCTLYMRLFLYVFLPLLLLIVFGVPVFIVHRLNKKATEKEQQSES